MYIFHREVAVTKVENTTVETALSTPFDMIGEQPYGPNKAVRLIYVGGFYADNITDPVCTFRLYLTPTTCSGLQVPKELIFGQEVSIPAGDTWFHIQYDLVYQGGEDNLFSHSCTVGYRSNGEAAAHNYDNRVYNFSTDSSFTLVDTNIQFTAELSEANEGLYVFTRGMYAEYL